MTGDFTSSFELAVVSCVCTAEEGNVLYCISSFCCYVSALKEDTVGYTCICVSWADWLKAQLVKPTNSNSQRDAMEVRKEVVSGVNVVDILTEHW